MKRAFAAFRRTARPAAKPLATGPQCWGPLLLVLAVLLVASTAEAQLELYVANQEGEGHVGKDSIVVYQVNGVGSLTSLTLLRTLAKPDVGVDLTGLATPSAVAVVQNKLFVANRSGGASGTGSITVYSRTAQGNTPPEATLQGQETELDFPSGLAVTETELFVANQSPTNKTPSITVYRWSMDSQGSVVFESKPVRSIKGVSTGLDGPGFLALDRANDELFVSNNYSGALLVYQRNDFGDQRYRRRLLAVGFTGFTFSTGVAVDPAHDELVLAYGFGVGTGTISVWTRTVSDTPPLPPIRTLSGPATKVDRDAPNGLALDVANNRFFVANRGTDTSRGFITAHALTWDPQVPPFADQPALLQHPAPELFSPVALALFDVSSSFDFALAVAPRTVPAVLGSPTFVTVTATVSRGAGRVTFTEPVADLQAIGASGRFDPNAFCDFTGPGSCSRTLRIVTGSSRGSFPIVVDATGAPTNCGSGNQISRVAGPCDVVREASFTLEVSDLGILRLVKTGSGRCTVTSAPAGIACGLNQTDCSASFAVPTVTLTAVPDATSFLTGWDYPNCTPQQPCQVAITPAATTTVRVACDILQALLTVLTPGTGKGTVTSDPPGITCPTDCLENFPINTVVTLTATPVTDSTFGGWTGCSPATNPLVCTVTMTEAKTVVATFIGPRLTVVKAGTGRGTVTSVPTRISCDPTCVATFDSGTEIVLTAVADAGSRFRDWSSSCTSISETSCTVRPATPQTTVTATFVAVEQLTVTNSQLGGQGTVTSDEAGIDGQRISCGSACSKTFDLGTSVTLRPGTGANSIFAGWAPLRPAPPECAGFDSTGKAPLDRQGRSSCTVVVNDNPTTVIASFVRTPQHAFIARLYLNVLQIAPPSLDNVDSLASSLGDAPLLSVQALIDAFFDGPGRPSVAPLDYVKVVFRALLWREPIAGEPCNNPPGDRVAERTLRTCVIDSSEFKELIAALFPTVTP